MSTKSKAAEKAAKPEKPGIKTSDMPLRIEEKIRKNYNSFKAASGEVAAEKLIKELAAALVAEQDNSKVINTANRSYLDRITDDPAIQAGLHFNLKVYGSLKAPDAKSADGTKETDSSEPAKESNVNPAPSSEVGSNLQASAV
jgi:hypothetical protein